MAVPSNSALFMVYGTISDILFKRFSTQVTLSKNKKVQKLSLGQLPKGSIFVLNVRNECWKMKCSEK